MELRAENCFLGQLIGDALGARYEFAQMHFGKPADQVVTGDLRGDGFLPMLGGGLFGLDKGQVTDDSEMALALMSSIIKTDGVSSNNILREYKIWMRSDPFDVGRATRYILSHPENRTPNDSRRLADAFNRRVRDIYGGDNLSNGCLMRASPLGILLAPMVSCAHRENPQLLASNILNQVAQDTKLTHFSHTATVATAAYVALLAGNIAHGRQGLCLTMQLVKTIAEQDPLIDLIFRRAANDDPLDPPADVNIGYLGTAFHLAISRTIAVGIKQSTFHRALVGTIQLGGDTDTNGCIVGAAIGSLVDRHEIPNEWSNEVMDHRGKKYMNLRRNAFAAYGQFSLDRIGKLLDIGRRRYSHNKPMVLH